VQAPGGACTSCTMRSASMTTAPFSARRAETLDLPEPIPPVRPTTSMSERTIGLIATNDSLYSAEPKERVVAARTLGRLAKRRVMRGAEGWPELSPGAVNAWLLLVTSKAPAWRDSLVEWVERPPTLGTPHEGFFYPDPLGFWSEIRRWATLLVRLAEPSWSTPDALAVTTLIHVGDRPTRIAKAREIMRPRLVLFLDVYEGFWAVADDGTVIGKAPQHPATHKLYRSEDMDGFLALAPLGDAPFRGDRAS
jgi:hypothetical protein